MRRTKEDAEVTRQKILKSALTVFGAKGYASASLEEIAREAGVTRGAIYWHFDGKANLYNALAQEYSQRGAQIMQQAIQKGGSLLDILRRVFVNLLCAVEDDANLRAMMEIHLFKTEMEPDLLPGRQERIAAGELLLENIATAMRQGIEAGLLRPDVGPLDMARAFMAFQNGLIDLWLMDPKAFSLSQAADHYADIFLGGVSIQ